MASLMRFALATTRRVTAAPLYKYGAPRFVRMLSSSDSVNITYSGGQASEGQGGYYGSGGARAMPHTVEHRPELLAMATDVQNVMHVMEELDRLKSLLTDEVEDKDHPVTGKSIEIKGKIKHLVTSPDFMDSLNRLECHQGDPVWGLSVEERELIQVARARVNEC